MHTLFVKPATNHKMSAITYNSFSTEKLVAAAEKQCFDVLSYAAHTVTPRSEAQYPDGGIELCVSFTESEVFVIFFGWV